MTAPDRAAAVEIAAAALLNPNIPQVRNVVDALAEAGCELNPARVAALEAVAEASDEAYRALEEPGTPQLSHRTIAAFYVLRRALDAVPAAEATSGEAQPGTPTWRVDPYGYLAAAKTESAHVYLSTACLHGHHDYCASMTGMQGAKRPAQCKWCAARCSCSCHVNKETGGCHD